MADLLQHFGPYAVLSAKSVHSLSDFAASTVLFPEYWEGVRSVLGDDPGLLAGFMQATTRESAGAWQIFGFSTAPTRVGIIQRVDTAYQDVIALLNNFQTCEGPLLHKYGELDAQFMLSRLMGGSPVFSRHALFLPSYVGPAIKYALANGIKGNVAVCYHRGMPKMDLYVKSNSSLFMEHLIQGPDKGQYYCTSYKLGAPHIYGEPRTILWVRATAKQVTKGEFTVQHTEIPSTGPWLDLWYGSSSAAAEAVPPLLRSASKSVSAMRSAMVLKPTPGHTIDKWLIYDPAARSGRAVAQSDYLSWVGGARQMLLKKPLQFDRLLSRPGDLAASIAATLAAVKVSLDAGSVYTGIEVPPVSQTTMGDISPSVLQTAALNVARNKYNVIDVIAGELANNPAGTALLCAAITWIGTPYLRGGHTKGKGVDCSNFSSSCVNLVFPAAKMSAGSIYQAQGRTKVRAHTYDELSSNVLQRAGFILLTNTQKERDTLPKWQWARDMWPGDKVPGHSILTLGNGWIVETNSYAAELNGLEPCIGFTKVDEAYYNKVLAPDFICAVDAFEHVGAGTLLEGLPAESVAAAVSNANDCRSRVRLILAHMSLGELGSVSDVSAEEENAADVSEIGADSSRNVPLDAALLLCHASLRYQFRSFGDERLAIFVRNYMAALSAALVSLLPCYLDAEFFISAAEAGGLKDAAKTRGLTKLRSLFIKRVRQITHEQLLVLDTVVADVAKAPRGTVPSDTVRQWQMAKALLSAQAAVVGNQGAAVDHFDLIQWVAYPLPPTASFTAEHVHTSALMHYSSFREFLADDALARMLANDLSRTFVEQVFPPSMVWTADGAVDIVLSALGVQPVDPASALLRLERGGLGDVRFADGSASSGAQLRTMLIKRLSHKGLAPFETLF